MAQPFIYRFTRDLRTQDHAGLARAAALGDVLPVLDRSIARLKTRLARSPRRAAFFCSAVARARSRRCASTVRADRAPRRARRHAQTISRARATPRARPGARATTASASTTTRASAIRTGRGGIACSAVHDAPAVHAGRDGGRTTQRRRRLPRVRAVLRGVAHAAARRHTTCRCSCGLRIDRIAERAACPLCTSSARATARRVPAGGRARARRSTVSSSGAALQYAVAMNVPATIAPRISRAHLSFGTISRARRRARDARAPRRSVRAGRRARVAAALSAIARDARFLFATRDRSTQRPPTMRCRRRCAAFSFARTHPALDAWRGGKTGFTLVDAGIAPTARDRMDASARARGRRVVSLFRSRASIGASDATSGIAG